MPDTTNIINGLIFDTVATLVVVIDHSGTIVRANAAAQQVSGYSGEELVGRPFADLFIAPEDFEKARAAFWELLQGRGGGRCEVSMTARDGRRLHIAWASNAVLGGDAIVDRPEGMPDIPFRWVVATGTDVTERRAVEEEHRLQRELLEKIFDHIPVMLSFFEATGGLKLVNRAWEQTLGWTFDEARKIDLLAEVYPDPAIRERAMEVINSGAGRWADFPLRTRNGNFIETAWANVHLSDGSVIGIGQDITARKRDEDALRLSESRLRWMVDSNIIGVMFYHLDGTITGANDSFLRMIGYTREDLERGHVRWNGMTPPEYADLDARGVADIQATNLCRPYEKEYFRKDGSRVPILIGGTAFDPGGNEGVCFVLDLSERRAAEAGRRQAQERLRLALSAANMIAWDWDPFTNDVSRIGDVRAFYGYDKLSAPELLSLIVPEDVPVVQEVLGLINAGPWPVTSEFRVRRADGAVRWVRDVCTADLKPDGSVSRAFGVTQDITHHRLAEQQLRTLNETLEQRVAERTAELTKANQALRESEAHFKELAERNERLVLEVKHRVLNNLAGLTGLVSAMSQRAGDVASFSSAIRSRLEAMVHIHRVLAESDWRQFDLQRLVKSTLDTVKHLSPHAVETTVDGPPVSLSSRYALPLTMVLVEWVTNSCKYGAHSQEGGRVQVRWEMSGGSSDGPDENVRFHWQEFGGPPITNPGKASVGTDLVNGFVRNELRGRCELTYPAAGAHHTIEFSTTLPNNA